MREQHMWEAVLSGDRFEDSNCEECGYHGAAFTLVGGPGGLAGVCPNCVVGRIDELEEQQGSIPAAIAYLREEAKREAAKQAGENPPSLLDVYTNFEVCEKCSEIVYAEDAFHTQLGMGESEKTYCADCHHEAGDRETVAARESEAARKNADVETHIDHSEFVRGYESGSLTVHVDRNASGYLYEQKGLVLEKYRTLQAVIRSFFFGGVIVGVGLFFVVEWYIASAVLLLSFLTSRVATHFAAKGVLQTALVRPSFYKDVQELGVLRVEEAT